LLPLEGPQVRFSDGSVESWTKRVDALSARSSPTVRIGAAIHSVRAVDQESMVAVAQWAADRECVLHAHVSEQPAENEQCHHAYSRSPMGVLADCGVLGRAFTAVHATHVTEHDVALLAGAHSTVCMCPTTERDLADGIGPTGRFREASVAVCLGSDSHAVIDLFEEARAVELDERLATGRRGTHGIGELMSSATVNGHRSLGWPDAGRIEPGALADLTTVTLRSPRTAGTDEAHAVAAVVFGAVAPDVTDVIVGGEHVVCNGRHRSIEVVDELDRAVRDVWYAWNDAR
jgi:formiminoglutamate deiminase